MWGIISTIVIGLLAGAVARLLVPGKENFGWIGTIVLGVVGGFVGGTLGSLVFAPHKFDITPPVNHAFLGAIVGAVILLVIYKFVSGRMSRT
ncbi:GlsB/YeaQ/YmgE family stress response membrane protein [Antrihabitans stalactiti]|uniref:GlsB/YeaQ/YmgE family stress response membrane protein n=1 Tax=Antrihabitans stalactiti TaxID=2584121 RepID=A0A848KP65_9NOCA|nr:GlsB/YeaQ/YmgE family stress response membrane protein [Antrihabitans stalactiti]NMN98080.1 GlsB/YeaQ/YmgE family stress response membrane protein [Antrihabitans stalactiti]